MHLHLNLVHVLNVGNHTTDRLRTGTSDVIHKISACTTVSNMK